MGPTAVLLDSNDLYRSLTIPDDKNVMQIWNDLTFKPDLGSNPGQTEVKSDVPHVCVDLLLLLLLPPTG